MDWEISEWNVSSGSGNSIDLSSFIETLNTNTEKNRFLGTVLDHISSSLDTGYMLKTIYDGQQFFTWLSKNHPYYDSVINILKLPPS